MKAVAASGEKGLLESHGGHARRQHHRGVREDRDGLDRHRAASEVRSGRTPSWSTSRCWSCSPILRANGFKTFIVSGGGVEFMRPWAERVYGIPPEQVVGSRAKVKYEAARRQAGAAAAGGDRSHRRQGRQAGRHPPVHRPPARSLAFGNSDGDFEMLEWTTSAPGPRFGAIVHHTDAEREWAYDRTSHIGQLARGLDEAPKRGWIVVDMKKDWKVIYPFEK